MRQRYQYGYLRCVKPKSGAVCWEFLWREYDGAGESFRHQLVRVVWISRVSRRQLCVDHIRLGLLKVKYVAVFTCAILNNQPMGFYSPAVLVKDAQRHGLRVKPMDVSDLGMGMHD